MPSFTPKSDKELAAENIIPKGEYGFEIMGAENTTFKSGSQGIKLKVGVFLDSGACRYVDDNLVFVPKAMFKVSQFSKCVGLYECYEQGSIDAEDCKGRTGRCKVDIEPEGEYPAKNKIAGYVILKPVKVESTPARPVPKQAPKEVGPEAEDDVPF